MAGRAVRFFGHVFIRFSSSFFWCSEGPVGAYSFAIVSATLVTEGIGFRL